MLVLLKFSFSVSYYEELTNIKLNRLIYFGMAM